MEELLINIGFSLIDPEKVMKLVQEGKAGEEQEELDGADKRIPIQVVNKGIVVHISSFRILMTML